MQERFLSAVLLVVMVAIANTASVDLRGWASAVQKLATINFYKQTLVYQQAVLQEGIPALNVPPVDPYHIDALLTFFQTSYENYTDIEITLNGLNVSDFSYFDINTAELDLDEMKANLSLYEDQITFTSNDLKATAFNGAGQLLSCECSHIESGVLETTFDSVKQLEVVGTILQVKRFDLVLKSQWVYIYPQLDCTGDVELMDPVSDILLDSLAYEAFQVVPETLNELAYTITLVLNDIFALRNITYEVGSPSADHSPKPQHKGHQLGHKLTEIDGNMSDKIVRQSRTRADHQESTKNSKKNPIKMSWTKN